MNHLSLRPRPVTVTTDATRPRVRSLRLVLGTICLVTGITVLTLPHLTLLVVALLFGLQLITAGVVRILLGLSLHAPPCAMTLVLGALTLIAGIVCVFRPGTSLLVIAWSVALGWLSDGISALAASRGEQSARERSTHVALGVCSVLGAALVVAFPGTSLLVFDLIGGVLLLAFGVIILIMMITVRRTADAGT